MMFRRITLVRFAHRAKIMVTTAALGVAIVLNNNACECSEGEKNNNSKNNNNLSLSDEKDSKIVDDDNNSSPTPRDPIELLIDKCSPIVGPLGFGGLIGFCTAVVFKRVSVQAAYGVGICFIGLQTLNYLGYVQINFLKVQKDAIEILDADHDGKLTSKDLIIIWRNLKNILISNVPSAGGFSAGLALGLRFG